MKNYLIFYIIIYFFFLCPEVCNAQGFSWAQGFTAIGGGAHYATRNMTVDANNNILVVGGFNGTLDVDQSANTFNLTAIGQIDGLLLKEDAAGHFQ